MTGTIFLGGSARRKSSGARSRFAGTSILMGKLGPGSQGLGAQGLGPGPPGAWGPGPPQLAPGPQKSLVQATNLDRTAF